MSPSAEGLYAAPGREAARLTFTGCLVLASFAVGLVFALARPLIGTAPESAVFKHLPLILFLLCISLHTLALAAKSDGRLYTHGMGAALWPFLLLGLFAVTGSLYARFEMRQENTFMTLGLYLLSMPLYFLWGREEANGRTVVEPLMRLWAVIAIAAIAASLLHMTTLESPLHESEFLVLPVFLYWYLASTRARVRWGSMLMIVLASVLTRKITGYVIGLSALLVAIGVWLSYTPKKWRTVAYTAGVAGLVLTIAAATAGYFYFRDYLPSGNARVRLHQYSAVLREFEASPLWGDAYTSSSGVTFVEGGVPMLIPTHSDVLDLLREGGCIGMGLWLWGMIRAIRKLSRRSAPGRKSRAFLRSMTFTVLVTVFSYCFNPLLLKPPQAFVIWGMLSLALSVATDRRPGQLNGV